MFKIMQKARRKEDGASDLVTTVLLLPLALFLILTLIDVSMYFNARSSVQNETREGVRLASMWGGAGETRLNNTGKNVASIIKGNLNPNVGRVVSVKCSPSSVANAGTRISCTTVYDYKTVTPGSDYFGFGAVTGQNMTITETALSETGYR